MMKELKQGDEVRIVACRLSLSSPLYTLYNRMIGVKGVVVWISSSMFDRNRSLYRVRIEEPYSFMGNEHTFYREELRLIK